MAETAKSSTLEIARRTLDILPLVLRVMSAQMRRGENGLQASHASVLGALRYRRMTLSDLAETMSVSPPTMSNTITTLEERTWVVRTRSEEDRRVVWIEITPQGRQVLDAMEDDVEARIAALLVDLSEDDQKALVKGLTVLRDVFAAALENQKI